MLLSNTLCFLPIDNSVLIKLIKHPHSPWAVCALEPFHRRIIKIYVITKEIKDFEIHFKMCFFISLNRI
jgi:hypothetical protein